MIACVFIANIRAWDLGSVLCSTVWRWRSARAHGAKVKLYRQTMEPDTAGQSAVDEPVLQDDEWQQQDEVSGGGGDDEEHEEGSGRSARRLGRREFGTSPSESLPSFGHRFAAAWVRVRAAFGDG